MTGLNILNAHPAFYWGDDGHKGIKPLAAIEIARDKNGQPTSRLHIGDWSIDTTGIFGNLHKTEYGLFPIAVSPALTLPPTPNLGEARALHFLVAWIFALSIAVYIVTGILSGRFWRTLRPRRHELTLSRLGTEILHHLALRRIETGTEIYNLLQKLAYIVVIFGLLPAMVLSGLTMSTGFTAAFPQLLDLFGGRESARTIHFLTAMALVAFTLIHVFEVVLTGFSANMRAITIGAHRTSGATK